jgi:hypothetical protein
LEDLFFLGFLVCRGVIFWLWGVVFGGCGVPVLVHFDFFPASVAAKVWLSTLRHGVGQPNSLLL